ncbi:MAG: glycosyltransferase [SAR324 cluster bacterium]|nr:glycosyltransferase [SAR324 cluster bacterium]
MRIVIDMQGAQSTASGQRGVGHYTMMLAQTMIKNHGQHEYILALNGMFPDSIEAVQTAFADLLPKANMRVWESSKPVNGNDLSNTWRKKASELTRETFLASLKPDIVLVSSLFEGFIDDATTSICLLRKVAPTAVILYDLIPLIHADHYLADPLFKDWYHEKLAHLGRADLLLSISESSRKEGLEHLQFSAAQIKNISTAADPKYQPTKYTVEERMTLLQSYGIKGQFVLYTGGIDFRKNIERLIRAFAGLPKEILAKQQLVIICAINEPISDQLQKIGTSAGLDVGKLVLTGFVPEPDLIALYHHTEVLVFPSLHEGFGLPVLEAMHCGTPVIGSNCTSIPEVLGFAEAQFDPYSEPSITSKLAEVLTDKTFQKRLTEHALVQAQKFTWEKTASDAIAIIEEFVARETSRVAAEKLEASKRAEADEVPEMPKPKLAYVSPLPPERSGISFYSTELLPELSKHYEIELIVAQKNVTDLAHESSELPIRNVKWFKENAEQFDRVLYHFGNSPFHSHMFELLTNHPGVVVLHDFFLSDLVSFVHGRGLIPGFFEQSWYESHGFSALHQFKAADDKNMAIASYPCNSRVISDAKGMIVHSASSIKLAQEWYPQTDTDHWNIVPLVRVPNVKIAKEDARKTLNLKDDCFVICSFGILGSTKYNHRLFEAWLDSDMSKNEKSMLIFVGENDKAEYGRKQVSMIQKNGVAGQVKITGWVDNDTFKNYLAAADVAVQLRGQTRGETSAAILDCMNYGLTTIVNAHGSMADLPDETVLKLPDEFTKEDLTKALQELEHNHEKRANIAQKGKENISRNHSPETCAEQYFASIEAFYLKAETGVQSLIGKIAKLPETPDNNQLRAISKHVAQSLVPEIAGPRQLLVDISELVQRDAKTGIQRVVRSILWELLLNPPANLRVEPVYGGIDEGYRYARQFTSKMLNWSHSALIDDPVEFKAGDIFIGLDLQHHVVMAQKEFYKKLRNYGVDVRFVVYDLLCISLAEYFGPGASELHTGWLNVITESDGTISISKAVADELEIWIKENKPNQTRAFQNDWFHLGADLEASAPTGGLPDDAEANLEIIKKAKSFLMVGTLEPRKGHAQSLAAFNELWAAGEDVVLVLIGKQGWKVDDLIAEIKVHPELGTRLFWLDGISDEYLELVYAASSCLVAASYGEGFGLPLIEAAQKNLPIIARDIPVFKEVASQFATYFDGLNPSDLAKVVKEWLALFESQKHPVSGQMPWLTWGESAKDLLKYIE